MTYTDLEIKITGGFNVILDDVDQESVGDQTSTKRAYKRVRVNT